MSKLFYCKGGRCPGHLWPANLVAHPRTCLTAPDTWPGAAALPASTRGLGAAGQVDPLVRRRFAAAELDSLASKKNWRAFLDKLAAARAALELLAFLDTRAALVDRREAACRSLLVLLQARAQDLYDREVAAIPHNVAAREAKEPS